MGNNRFSADVAQLVERRLPKPKVAGSTPVVRFRTQSGFLALGGHANRLLGRNRASEVSRVATPTAPRLRGEPSGFEGRGSVVSEVRPLGRLTVAERPHVPDISLNRDAARLSPTARPDERDHLVACVNHFFGLPARVSPLPHLPLAVGPGPHLVATLDHSRIY